MGGKKMQLNHCPIFSTLSHLLYLFCNKTNERMEILVVRNEKKSSIKHGQVER